jgi:hypothetical protein
MQFVVHRVPEQLVSVLRKRRREERRALQIVHRVTGNWECGETTTTRTSAGQSNFAAITDLSFLVQLMTKPPHNEAETLSG